MRECMDRPAQDIANEIQETAVVKDINSSCQSNGYAGENVDDGCHGKTEMGGGVSYCSQEIDDDVEC